MATRWMPPAAWVFARDGLLRELFSERVLPRLSLISKRALPFSVIFFPTDILPKAYYDMIHSWLTPSAKTAIFRRHLICVRRFRCDSYRMQPFSKMHFDPAL
jgi:hypothetical protein